MTQSPHPPQPDKPSVIESDQRLLERITDALRAGPGTLAWEQAIRDLAPGTSRVTDPDGIRAETELLMRVRERLAMGRSWREVRAGDGFTRKLMERLDQQPQSAGSPVTLWVFAIAMVAVLGVLLWGAVSWYRDNAASGRPDHASPSRPGGLVVAYGSPWIVWDFGKPWPAQTRFDGALATEADGNGWRAEPAPLTPADAGPAGRAATLTLPLPLVRGVCVIEVELDLPPDIDPHLTTHLFLATTTDADERLATRPAGQEWVWQLQHSGSSVVLGNASVVMLSRETVPRTAGRMTVQIQVADAGQTAAVSINGQPVFRGSTELALSSGSELFLGVRFIARDDLRGGVVTARSVRVFESR